MNEKTDIPVNTKHHDAHERFHRKVAETNSASYISRIAARQEGNPRRPARFPLTIGFVGSLEMRHHLGATFQVVDIYPNYVDEVFRNVGKPNPSEEADIPAIDLVLIEATWNVANPRWREAFLKKGEAENPVNKLARLAKKAGIPVVAWFTETIGNSRPFFRIANLVDYSGFAFPYWKAQIKEYGLPLPTNAGYMPLAYAPVLWNPFRFGATETNTLNRELFILADGMSQILFGGDDSLVGQMKDFLDYRFFITDSEKACRNKLGQLPLELAARFIGAVEPSVRDSLFTSAQIVLDYQPQGIYRQRFSSLNALAAAASGCIPLRNFDPARPPHPVVKAVSTGKHQDNVDYVRHLTENPAQMAAQQVSLMRRAVRDHSLAKRIKDLAQTLGLEFGNRIELTPKVSVVCPTMRPEFYPLILQNFEGQTYPNKELIVVYNLPPEECGGAPEAIRQRGHRVTWVPQDKTIGVAIATGLALADGDYWAKFDDDDLYYPEFLLEPMLLRQAVDFDIYGKGQIQTFAQELDTTFVRKDLTDSFVELPYVGGGTLVSKRQPDGHHLGFPESIRGYADTEFLLSNLAKGRYVVSGSPFDFVQVRYADDGHHTWNHDLEEFNANYQVCSGLDPAMVSVNCEESE